MLLASGKPHFFHFFFFFFQLASFILCFEIISDQVPTYLSDFLYLYSSSQLLYFSADTHLFRRPFFCTKSSGQRSFSYKAATAWNQLPVTIHHSSSGSSFKFSLKFFFLISQTFSSIPMP